MHQQPRTMDPPGRSNSRSRSAQVCGVSGRVLNSPGPRSRLTPAPLFLLFMEMNRSAAGESGSPLLCERRDSLGEIGGPAALLLDPGLDPQLVGHVLVGPVVELPLGPGVGPRRAFGQLAAQRSGPAGQFVAGPDLLISPHSRALGAASRSPSMES